MTLQELLQARAAKHDDMKTILNKAETEGRELTAEEEAKFNALDAEYEQFTAQIQAAEAIEARKQKMQNRDNDLNGSQREPYRPSASALGGMPVQPKQLDNAGFQNLGEFINSIRFGDSKGRLAELPVSQGQGTGYQVPDAFRGALMPTGLRNEWTMGTGSEGGFAVPTQFDPNVKMILPSSNIVRSRAMVIPAGDPPDSKITMPALDQGSKGVFGGVEVKWIAEGEEKPETDGMLREVTLDPQEVAATTVVTDKLLRNWAAGGAFIESLLNRARAHAEDLAFLTGNGIGKPLGMVSAPGSLGVNRTTANKIGYIDVLRMYAKLLPESVGSAVWVASQSALVEIASIKDDAGRNIFIGGDATRGIPSTLFGIPIIFTGKTPSLGKKGDLVLVDMSYYLIKDGSGPFIAASEHVLFRQNKTVIKMFWNVDGEPWVIEALKLDNGDLVSPYVVLDIPSGG